jgi:hypothetical protein
VIYYFASEEDRKLFAESPEKYLPTYGGWCATAMAKGEKVEIDPTNFKVTNGRLFLFFKAFYANAIKDWNKDEANLTVKADANWMKIAVNNQGPPMRSCKTHTIASWTFQIFAAAILAQTLFFKFTGAEESKIHLHRARRRAAGPRGNRLL